MCVCSVTRPLYCSPLAGHYNESLSYRAANAGYKKVYEAAGIKIVKVTQQGRGEGQRDLEDIGVDNDLIQELGHYLHDAQHESYLTNLPVKALVGAASGESADVEYMKGYNPPQLCEVREGLIEALVAKALPWLEEQVSAVKEAADGCETGIDMQEVCALTSSLCAFPLPALAPGLLYCALTLLHLTVCTLAGASLHRRGSAPCGCVCSRDLHSAGCCSSARCQREDRDGG